MRIYLPICIAVLLTPSGAHSHWLLHNHNVDHVRNNFDFMFNPTLTDEAERNNFKAIKTFHRCKCIDSVMDFQYAHQQHKAGGDVIDKSAELFSKHALLSHLRDKTFAIMGDSLGLQMFYSLDASLLSERSSTNHTLARPKNKYQLSRGISFYQQYNASLQFFHIPTILQATSFLLSETFQEVDILLIVMGAWYKPGFQNYIPRLNLTEATEDYNVSITELRAIISNQRTAPPPPTPSGDSDKVTSVQRPLQVLWQLNTHMGPSDDERYKHLAGHYNGSFWDEFPIEAEWVPIFNDVIRKVAGMHGDTILDTYTISKQLIRHANALRQSWRNSPSPSSSFPYFSCLKVHSDSLHYCQGGVFRASALLLQKVLQCSEAFELATC